MWSARSPGKKQSGRPGSGVLEQVRLASGRNGGGAWTMRVPLAVLGALIARPHRGQAPTAPGTTSLSTLRLTSILPLSPSTSLRRSFQHFALAQTDKAGQHDEQLQPVRRGPVITAISSTVAGTATRLTAAVPAPRIFGGARSISSSSSAAWSSERSRRYAAASLPELVPCRCGRPRSIPGGLRSRSLKEPAYNSRAVPRSAAVAEVGVPETLERSLGAVTNERGVSPSSRSTWRRTRQRRWFARSPVSPCTSSLKTWTDGFKRLALAAIIRPSAGILVATRSAIANASATKDGTASRGRHSPRASTRSTTPNASPVQVTTECRNNSPIASAI